MTYIIDDNITEIVIEMKYNLNFSPTFTTFAGTPKISTHFRPLFTRGRSKPSILFTPYLKNTQKYNMS